MESGAQFRPLSPTHTCHLFHHKTSSATGRVMMSGVGSRVGRLLHSSSHVMMSGVGRLLHSSSHASLGSQWLADAVHLIPSLRFRYCRRPAGQSPASA